MQDIELLLGSECFVDFLSVEGNRPYIKKAEGPLPALVKTVFGWITMGKIQCIPPLFTDFLFYFPFLS